jgi:hypothetical protein
MKFKEDTKIAYSATGDEFEKANMEQYQIVLPKCPLL